MKCPECGSNDIENYQTCVCRDCGIGFCPDDDWISVIDRLLEESGEYVVYGGNQHGSIIEDCD